MISLLNAALNCRAVGLSFVRPKDLTVPKKKAPDGPGSLYVLAGIHLLLNNQKVVKAQQALHAYPEANEPCLAVSVK